MGYYYCEDGINVVGPVSEKELRQRVESGNLSPETPTCREGSDEWNSASSYLHAVKVIPAAQPSAASTEEPILSEPGVSITPSRVIIHGTTYALRNISSVRMEKIEANHGCAIGVITLGAIVAIGFLASYLIGQILIAMILIGIGLLMLRLNKSSFTVAISSSSGEVRALTSKDKNQIARIVAAINEAIVLYR